MSSCRGEKKRISEHEAYDKIKSMIWSIIRDLTKGDERINTHDKYDMHIIAMEKTFGLWKRKFDKDRNTKFSSFVYSCARNLILRTMRRIGRSAYKTNCISRIASEMIYDDVAGCNTIRQSCTIPGLTEKDEQVRCFSEWLGKNIGMFTKSERRTIKAILSHPNMNQTELAKKMKFKYPSAVSMSLSRMRVKVENSHSFKEEVL